MLAPQTPNGARCRRCGSREFRHRLHRFKDGVVHHRFDCKECGRCLCFAGRADAETVARWTETAEPERGGVQLELFGT
jgi:hypothetical protein